MTDDADRAADSEALDRAKAISRALDRIDHSGRPSALYCVCCNTAIHAVRRAAVPGVQTCVTCEWKMEAKR